MNGRAQAVGHLCVELMMIGMATTTTTTAATDGPNHGGRSVLRSMLSSINQRSAAIGVVWSDLRALAGYSRDCRLLFKQAIYGPEENRKIDCTCVPVR